MARKYEFLPLVNIFNRRSLEAGLIQKWRRDRTIQSNNFIFTVAHIEGALLALLCGLGLSSVAFMAECVVFLKLKQANCHKLWLVLFDMFCSVHVVSKNENLILPYY